MKNALSASSFLFLVAWCHGFTPRQCCNDSLIAQRVCADGSPLQIGCRAMLMLNEYRITENGVTTLDTPEYVWSINDTNFCVGRRKVNSNSSRLTGVVDIALLCYETLQQNSDGHLLIYGVLVLISSLFLVLTVAVYFYLPQLRDLQGKCIMCQCASLAIAYLNLGLLQLAAGTQYSKTFLADCSVNSFMMYFWFMSTFLWLNVVCINIYRSVIQSRSVQIAESRQFFYYNLYAWGTASAFLVWALVANYIEGKHSKPRFGGGRCWFQDSSETWLFFYGPLAFILVVNIVLFVMASIALWKKSTNYEARTLDTLKYKFFLYLKLFLVTGITWIFEVASFAHGTMNILWTITDIINCLQGLMFFLLLVLLRKRTLVALKDRGVGGVVVAWLLSHFKDDREAVHIVEDSEHDNGEERAEAPFDVNLN